MKKTTLSAFVALASISTAHAATSEQILSNSVIECHSGTMIDARSQNESALNVSQRITFENGHFVYEVAGLDGSDYETIYTGNMKSVEGGIGTESIIDNGKKIKNSMAFDPNSRIFILMDNKYKQMWVSKNCSVTVN